MTGLFWLMRDIEIGPIEDGFGPAPAAARVPYGVLYPSSFSVERACNEAGTIGLSGQITGDVDTAGEAAELSLSGTVSYDQCRATVNLGDVLFTLEEEPTVQVAAQVSVDADAFTYGVSLSGAFSWAGDDGRAGVCSIAVSVEAHRSPTTAGAVASGTACDLDVATWVLFPFHPVPPPAG